MLGLDTVCRTQSWIQYVHVFLGTWIFTCLPIHSVSQSRVSCSPHLSNRHFHPGLATTGAWNVSQLFYSTSKRRGQCLIPCEWSHLGRLSSRAVFRQRSGLLLIRHRLTQKAGTRHSSQLQQNGLFLAISRGWPFPQSPSTPIFPSSQQSQRYTMTYLIVANQFLLSWTISSHSQASMVGSSCWWACLLLKTAGCQPEKLAGDSE